jgi:hypothetical protein
MDVGGQGERGRRCSWVGRAPAWAALLALALVLAIIPASAAAMSENAAATHAYLVATSSYEETELSNLPQEVEAREAAAARISGECPGILANAPPHEEVFGFGLVGPGPVGPVSQAPLSARAEGERHRQSRQLGDLKLELSFALDDSRTQPDREAVGALIRALTPLKWSNPKITFLVQVIAATAKEELEIPAPPVCEDMKSWVASGYKTLTPISREIQSRSEALLKRSFEIIALAEKAPIQTFPKILAPYENASDRTLARHTEALNRQLRKGRDTQAAVRKRLEAAVGLPAAKLPKTKRPTKRPVVIGRGKTAAGGSFVATAERSSHVSREGGCNVFVTITEPSRPALGLLTNLFSEGTGRCLSRSHVNPEPAVHCNSGLLTVEANLLARTRRVRLLLSDGNTITSPAIIVPARLGGPTGLYYQVVRGPSPIPVSLTELDAQGATLAVLKLPAVVECTKHPIKYFPHGIVRLVHESPPQMPAFTIRAERYRKLGSVHFELKLEESNEELILGRSSGSFEANVAVPRGWRVFQPQTSSGCQPQPYVIIYGLLKAPDDSVLARVSGTLVPLRKVVIPAQLHAGGVLAYGELSPLPTEVLVRDASGRTIDRANLAEAAKSDTETCEGEAEGP